MPAPDPSGTQHSTHSAAAAAATGSFRLSPPPWLILAILAVIFWGLWAFLSKVLGDAMSAAQSQVISTLGLAPILVMLAKKREFTRKTARIGILYAFVGGLIGGAGNVVFYKAMTLGGEASTVIPITSLYPMVTVVLALVVLRERITGVQTGGIILAITSIILFNINFSPVSTKWLPYALLPILLWGIAGLFQKMCTLHLSTEGSTLWFLLGFVVISIFLFCTQPMSWQISGLSWLLAIMLGLYLGLGNLTLIAAFATQGKASIITPLSGLYPLVSVPLAIFVLGEKITVRELLALLLAIPAIIALSVEVPPPTKSTSPQKLAQI